MPKRFGFLYEKMLDKEYIRRMILRASKNKRSRKDIQKVLGHLDEGVDTIFDLLSTQTYIPSKPKHKRVYDKSGQKERDIHYVKFFPDAVIQWMIVDTLQPIFMRSMYPWVCASVPGRGGAKQREYLKRALHKDIRGTKYALQLDVRKYYPSINVDKLMEILSRKIKDPKMLNLIRQILATHSPGLAIGYYLNQWLANVYLEPIDWAISKMAGVKYYCRYMDNFTLLGPNKKKLHLARERISALFKEYDLAIKNDWQVFPVDSRMVESVGCRFNHHVVIMRKRNSIGLARRCRKVIKLQNQDNPVSFRRASGLLSSIGALRYFESKTFTEKYVAPIDLEALRKVVRNEGKSRQSS